MTSIEVNNSEVLAALNRLAQNVENVRPALLEIGEALVESTKQRFVNESGPNNIPWARNSQETIQRKGRDQPLTEHGTLGDTINYQVSGKELQVGSNLEYAEANQFGLGVIARPFLGLSNDDNAEILNILNDYFTP